MKRMISLLMAFVLLVPAVVLAQGRRVDPRVVELQRAIAGTNRYGSSYDPYYNQRYSRYDRRRSTVRDLAVLAGVVGAVVIANKVIDHRQQQNGQVVYGQQGPMGPAPLATSVSDEADLPFALVNKTSAIVEVYDGDKRPENLVIRLAPCGQSGDAKRVGPPRVAYNGFAVVLDPRTGRMASKEVPRQGTNADPSTLAFVFPSAA